MASSIPINHFDRSKPFYPLVIAYISQLVGVKELLNTALLGKRDVLREAQEKSLTDPQKIEFLTKEIELRSDFQGNHIKIDAGVIAQELFAEGEYLLSSISRFSGSLLILAYEITKDEPYHDNNPLWEFLRHCRNAAAHNGKFDFKGGEPKRLAKWGTYNIDKSLQGLNLFKDITAKGLLSPGDPIRLLWDIEQAYPNIK